MIPAPFRCPPPAYTYIANQRFTVTLPPASGGTAPLTYTLTPFASIPAGLIFDATATARTLSGTPTGATISTDLTYTATGRQRRGHHRRVQPERGL